MKNWYRAASLGCLIYACSAGSAFGQGIALSGVGAVNRSFGSVAVAAPIDAAGAINYNPATLSGFKSSQTEIGLEFLWADSTASSNIEPLGLSGSTDNEAGVNPIPAFAIVQKPENSDFTFGLGFFGLAGYRSDYPSSLSNPVLTPQPPAGVGLGHVTGSAEFLEVVPSLSWKMTDEISLGFAPRLSIAKLQISPNGFAPLTSTGAYPDANDPNYRYGGGFQTGVFYEGKCGLNLGASWKSPLWIESFSTTFTDETGISRPVSYHFDYPSIASIGAAYTGVEQWIFASDLRYFDYSNTDGFGPRGFNADGSVRGLGWDSIFSVSAGVQYKPVERWSLRMGYTFNENPIPDSSSVFNVASPLVTQHLLGVGASYEAWKNTILSIAWLHGFENSVEGPIEKPGIGAIPGTSVKNELSAEAIAVALTFLY